MVASLTGGVSFYRRMIVDSPTCLVILPSFIYYFVQTTSRILLHIRCHLMFRISIGVNDLCLGVGRSIWTSHDYRGRQTKTNSSSCKQCRSPTHYLSTFINFYSEKTVLAAISMEMIVLTCLGRRNLPLLWISVIKPCPLVGEIARPTESWGRIPNSLVPTISHTEIHADTRSGRHIHCEGAHRGLQKTVRIVEVQQTGLMVSSK